ncbi:gamma-aminobutyric acid receptor subunit alpha-4 isoform X5 [Malaya genurostris]|uniref:gamma-aminobutyric acid receptor subunit alpha-4 isoform X5 n=1 Tax=Malaya genurostris TaxID=325434 RepID=UPI0026F39131|nr:gamma-aminobutyric acid receptor subunit alpha-4 isoform X5 [Malaya genurostris]
MGYMCGKAHHRTSPPEQSWIESLTCTQLSEPATPKSTESTSFSIAGCNKKYQKHHRKACSESNSTLPGHHVARARITSETAGFGISFHYPFNLFHPFHSYSLQYSTIILDKLSQFITKHVAARGSPIGNATTAYAPNGIPSEQPPIASPLAAAPACLHSHDTGCRPFPSVVASASENQPHSSSSRASVGSSTGTLAPGGGFTSPPSSSPSSFLSFDPFAAPVAYIGSTATSTGCTKVASSSSSSPLSELASSLLSSPSHASPAAPAPSFRRPDVSLQLPSTAPPITHLTSSSTSSLTSATATATTTTTSTSTSTTTARPSSSHYLVRHSLCLYAASSVILALCYLTIPTVASEAPHTMRGKTRFAEGKSDKEILDHLLKGSRYDKRLLPPVDDADFCCGMQTPEMAKHMPDTRIPGRPQNRGSLTVNISVLLLSLASPDESSLKYEVEFLLQQQWYDPRLRYANHSQYEFLNAIHHHEDIWLPDTYFIMHGDFKDPIIPMHFALRIYRNGTINYLMRRHLILSCQGRLNIFPFDDPLCSFALESISYEQSAIRYVWKNDEDTLRKSPSLTTLNAYLIQNQTITCPIKASWRAEGQTLSEEDEEFLCNLCQRRFEEQGNYSCLKVDLMFTRDRAFYFTTVFIPGIILVTSSFITFWLEWNAVPARVMIGVTTMLNFFTTSNGFRSTLPVVSNLTAMNVWDGVCMCFIYASLLEFVCVNYVGRKRPLHNVVYRPGENPVTQRLPAVLNRIGIILASPLQETIETEFRTAIAAEKPVTVPTAAQSTTGSASPSTIGSGEPKAASRPASILVEEGVPLNDATTKNRVQRQPTIQTEINEVGVMETSFGVKKRDSGGPNEIVACTSCAGGTSPCTHSANNGCATETCFVQVRKKEPPHPIRVAKTIDVIARITFPSAYAVFLIFFFIHYKGFS